MRSDSPSSPFKESGRPGPLTRRENKKNVIVEVAL